MMRDASSDDIAHLPPRTLRPAFTNIDMLKEQIRDEVLYEALPL
jgi:hypothetical protein